MKKTGFILLAGIAATVLVAGCKKSDEFVNPVYMCNCGVMNWLGSEYPLLGAHYIVPDTANPLSRRYYISAETSLEGELLTHNLNMRLEVDSVTKGVFYVEDDDDLEILVEEINYNDPIDTLVTYLPVDGVVSIAPALLGGTESVQFNLVLKRFYNGSLVGFEVPFSGNLSVNIIP